MELTTAEERMAQFESLQPKESTTKDYWDTMNPFALKGTRPELRTSEEDYLGEPLDVEDEAFKELIAMSDTETQNAMYGAFSTDHAYKIWTARDTQREAGQRIAGDAISTQLAMGLLPAMMSPTTALPMGAFGTAMKVGQAASRITNASRGALAAAAGGAVANVGDELIMGNQDLQTDKLSAALFGAAFSAPFGFMGGLIAGPMGKHNAEVSHSSSDTYKADFVNDPDIILEFAEPGGPPIMKIAEQGEAGSKTTLQAQGSTSTERQNKLMIDRVPWLSGMLNSDVTKAYMHESAVGRAVMTKLVTPSTALYDKVGNAIAIGRTAMDYKMGQKAINNRKDLEMELAFTEAKKNLYMGSKQDFLDEISVTYHSAANKQSQDLADFLNVEGAKFDNKYGDARDVYLKEKKGDVDPLELNALADAMHANKRRKHLEGLKKEFYTKNKVEFKHESTAIVRGTNAYRNFYSEHLKSNKDLDMVGTRSANDNKLYAPRLLDWDNFKNDATFLSKFQEDSYLAFKSHGANSDLSEAELRLLAKEYTDLSQNVDFRQNFTHGSFMAPTLSGDARMKGRKFEMDENIMSKYRMTDMEELAGRYHYQMSGRQAVQYAFGTADVGEIMKKVGDDMLKTEGKISEDMIDHLRNTILDLSGQLRMNALSGSPAWQVTRSIQVFNSARLGGGFGGNQFIELAATMFMNHLPSVMAGRTGKSFKNAASVLYTKGKDMDDFNRYLINSGFMEDALHTSKVNRFADTEAGFNSGAVEKGLHWFTDKMYKYNGMRYFKSVMEDMAGGALLVDIPRLAKKAELGKLSNNEKARLSRLGLDPQALKELGADIELNTKEGFNLNGFDPLNRDRLQLAIQRGIAETVIQGDSLHLPTWMKVPTPMKSLIFQFMRFPMIAHSTYLRRGMSEAQAEMAAAVVASTITFMGMKYLREQASIAMGMTNERDAKFNYFDDRSRRANDAMMKGALESTNYIAPLGMFTGVLNAGYTAVTGKHLGSDYRGGSTVEQLAGPTFGGLAPDLFKIMQAAAEGDITDERTAMKAKSLIPGANLPLINEAFKFSIEKGL